MAISLDTVVVGSHYDSTATATKVGSAYVFVRSGTTWSEQQHLFASDGAYDDSFGNSVAVAGNIAVVGAAHDDTAAGYDAGSAYVFARSGTTWTEQAHLLPAAGGDYAYFGNSVAVVGATVVVGQPGYDTSFSTDAGAVYVYVRSTMVWSLQKQLLGQDDPFDAFGFSVAMSGTTVVAGAPFDNPVGGKADSGSAFVYRSRTRVWPGRISSSPPAGPRRSPTTSCSSSRRSAAGDGVGGRTGSGKSFTLRGD